MKRLLVLLAFLATPVFAEPLTADKINLDIGTPPVIVVKHALAQRYSRLVRFYDAGVMGIDINGMVQIRDYSKLQHLTLKQTAEKLVDQENPDRMSLIYAIAEAHGGREQIPVVREMMIKRYREQVKPGWWIQDEKGNWHQKQ